MVWKRAKLGIFLFLFEILFLILFGIFVKYDDSADADPENYSAPPGKTPIDHYYAMFQDVHVMMFIGFGFLMTFLKRYGYGAVGYNFVLASIVLQWSTLISGFLHLHDGHIIINIENMLTYDFAAATVLISFGALLGKVSLLQLAILTLVEIVLFNVNEWIGLSIYQAVDVGGSMFVHTFGAYFGIAAARVLYKKDVEKASDKEGSVYHSDLFAMIGSIFLWMFWPSFNSAVAGSEDARHRAVLNTYYSLAACVVMTFAVSSLVNKEDKLNMVHVQNSTLAGGVAVGTMADMMIQPWGALLIGCVSAIISVLGYEYITPWMARRLKLHDTCGVNNLHGMPGIMAGLGGIVASAIAHRDEYGKNLYTVFPARAPVFNSTEYLDAMDLYGDSVGAGDGRTAGIQAAYQAAALGTTLGIAIVGGAITGAILRIPIWSHPKESQVFDDTDYWLLEEGLPGDTDSDVQLRDIRLIDKENGNTATKI